MKISVTLPNYNHATFLAQCIDGVQSQTYSDWELLITDDGSTDDSRQIIESYAARDPRIKPIFFPENRGAMAAFAASIGRATGQLLFGNAADDYISNPQFFEFAIAALERFPQVAGVFACAAVVDGRDGKELWQMGSYHPAEPPAVDYNAGVKEDRAPFPMQFIPPQEAMAAFLTNRVFIPGAAAIWKRELVADLGGYDEKLGPQSDYFLNHALAALHGVVFVDMPVIVVRAFESSYGSSASDDEFFRRHALVEKKLRALDLPYKTDERLFAQWRASTVGARTAEGFQRQMFEAMYRIRESLQPWQLSSFTPEFAAFFTSVNAECVRFEGELDKRVERAHQIFDDIAGPIASSASSAGSASTETAPPHPPIPAGKNRRSWWRRTRP